MLSAPNRMRRSSDFGATVRRGRRAGSRTVVVHVLSAEPESGRGPVVGFVVPKAVGSAVVRNRAKRRLRALIRPLLPSMGPSTCLVVRALPAAGGADAAALGHDLVRALGRAGALRTARTANTARTARTANTANTAEEPDAAGELQS